MKKTEYEVRGYTKHIEEDNYEYGCDPKTSRVYTTEIQFQADSVEKLLVQLAGHCGVAGDKDAITLNACDEVGRVDIQLLENSQGTTASKPELEAFKKGKCRLWLADYSFCIEKVERGPVDLENFEKP